jgi:hypothetical protein
MGKRLKPVREDGNAQRGVTEMTTAERNHEWLPFKLFVIAAALVAAGWIALFVAMALWPL